MSISVIEQAKIQAQVLIPLVKALQAELGKAGCHPLRFSLQAGEGGGVNCTGDAGWMASAHGYPALGTSASTMSMREDDLRSERVGRKR